MLVFCMEKGGQCLANELCFKAGDQHAALDNTLIATSTAKKVLGATVNNTKPVSILMVIFVVWALAGLWQ